MSDKPPVGIRPQWLVLEERQKEIRDAIKRYDEQAVICPDEWLIELQDIERELAILLPRLEPEPKPVNAEFTPRRFVSISRTLLSPTETIIDAIDDEGVAWSRASVPFPPQPPWQRIEPLPAREVPQF